jgi:hypothetical protein
MPCSRRHTPRREDLLPHFRMPGIALDGRRKRVAAELDFASLGEAALLLHARAEAFGGKYAENRADHGAKQT